MILFFIGLIVGSAIGVVLFCLVISATKNKEPQKKGRCKNCSHWKPYKDGTNCGYCEFLDCHNTNSESYCFWCDNLKA